MKVNFFNTGNMIIYLNKYYTKDIDALDKEELEEYFKKLFIRLHLYYNVELAGYYNIILYYDKYYGMIINIEKEEIEYCNYFDSEIDMRITLPPDNNILYELSDYFDIDNSIRQASILYTYKNKIYLKLNKKIDFVSQGRLLEHSKLIYEETNKIIKFGKKHQMASI